MNNTIRNILAVVAGWFGGSVINIGMVQSGYNLLPIKGVDPNDMEALAAILPTLESKYFIFPFLAHALGTLIGALIAALISKNSPMKMALIVGGIFLLGGIVVSFMLPGVLWFSALDITLAYIPMAWIGAKLAEKIFSQ